MNQYKHKEAFCLMIYTDKITGEMEILWNSRDGVTPFVIKSKNGNESFHDKWNCDICVPDFKPSKGQRVFVDATRENIMGDIHRFVEHYWNDTKTPMSQTYNSKKEAIEELLKSWLSQEGLPTVITI